MQINYFDWQGSIFPIFGARWGMAALDGACALVVSQKWRRFWFFRVLLNMLYRGPLVQITCVYVGWCTYLPGRNIKIILVAVSFLFKKTEAILICFYFVQTNYLDNLQPRSVMVLYVSTYPALPQKQRFLFVAFK